MKVFVDPYACCLNGECVSAAPTVFRMEGEELAYDPSPPVSERSAVEDAIAGCPTQAISVDTDA
jgi:ferredoxin